MHSVIAESEIVDAARSFLGVKFTHQGMSRLGLDCLGLLLVSAAKVGLTFDGVDVAEIDVPNYSTRPDTVFLRAQLERFLMPVTQPRMGDVVLLELLKARGLLPAFDANVDVFVLVEDEALRASSLKLIQDLRSAGLVVDYPLTPGKSDKQFKRAQELKAAFTARLEGETQVRIRNLKSREEVLVAVGEVAHHTVFKR